jgi:hypothetical protein
MSAVSVEELILSHVRTIVGFACLLCVGTGGAAELDLDLPTIRSPSSLPGKMMHRYWLRQAGLAAKRWQYDYEARKNPAQIAVYQARLREKFLEAIGGLPQRTPLNPKVTGTVRRGG